MEEEDDLEALRLAALQTIKPKKYQNAHRPKDHIPYYRPLTNPNLIAIVPKDEPFFAPPPEPTSVEVQKKVKEKSPESDENVEEEKTIRSKFRRDSENEIVKLDEDQLDFECEGESDLLELHNDDSLEKLMDEMEQEFIGDSPRAKNGTKKSDKPSPKLEEVKRSLTPKEKLSPYYDKRRSPSPRRRSPIRRRSRSPWLKRSNSPRRRSPSPRKRSITPRRRSFSPRKRSLTPRKRSISPKRRSRSPRYRRSPLRRSISPRFRRRTPSPRRSPIRRRSPSLSPRRSPVRLKRLSPRRKLSPRRSLSPRSRRLLSPPYRSPRRSLSPRRRISPRRKRSRSPLPKPRRSPEKRRLPKEDKKSEEKEEVVDPKLEARRKKFENNSVVAPIQKKIRLKTTQEEEEEKKLQINHVETNEEETDLNINDNPLLLRILNRKKINLEEGSLDIKDLVNRLNKADKVKTEKKPKRRPVLINQIEDAISEEPKILEKVKKKKAKAALTLFSESAKLKKKKVEKVIEIEDDVVEVPTQVKIKEKADDGTDLRAELSRRRAERLKETNFQPAMRRIIQSAIEGAVIGNRKRLQKPEEISKKMSLQGRRVRVVDSDNVPENDSEEDQEDFNGIGSYGSLRMTTIRSGKRFK